MRKTIKILTILLFTLALTGCFKRDSMEGINIYTTVYPIEFITSRLYGEYSNIKSTYPNGVDVKVNNCDNCDNEKYTLTEKQISDYSKSNLLIFNSVAYEGRYVKNMLENNNKLKIINASDNLSTEELIGIEELWLDPSRMLTLSRNIKNGFNEYLNNYYLKNSVDNNFNVLKEELDKLQAKLSDLTKKADNKIIVVGNDVFKFLEKDKYGLTVYSLDEKNQISEKMLNTITNLINKGTIKYIYIMQYEEPNATIQKLIANTDVEVINLHSITNLSETERSNKSDYFTIMNSNMELLRKNLYKQS